jgi:hypothetical protein
MDHAHVPTHPPLEPALEGPPDPALRTLHLMRYESWRWIDLGGSGRWVPPTSGTRLALSIDEFFGVLDADWVTEDKHQAPSFTAGWGVAGRRRSEDLLDISMVTLDSDHGMPVHEAISRMPHIAWYIYTSRRHTEAAPRFRVVVPLARDVGPAHYRALWSSLAELVPTADPKAQDAARLNFMPSLAPDGAPPSRWRSPPGALLYDPTVVLARQRHFAETSPATSPKAPTTARASCDGALARSSYAATLPSIAALGLRSGPTVSRPAHRDTEMTQRLRRIELAGNPIVRRDAAFQLGGRIHLDRSTKIMCPRCGRPSVWYYYDPSRRRVAQCDHLNTCGWSGTVHDLVEGRPGSGS